jgi:hypothetical protein
MRLLLAALLILTLLVPAGAQGLRAGDREMAQAAVAYGLAHLDAASGLVCDDSGVPNLAESSVGFVAACLATGQSVEVALPVLDRLLSCQQTEGPQTGHFPWQLQTDLAASPEAGLYLAPLLGYLAVHHAAALGPQRQQSLREACQALLTALQRMPLQPADDTRWLLRAAARASLSAALDRPDGAASAEVGAWCSLVTTRGLPAGHSATFDASRLVALKWVYEFAPEPAREQLQQALGLAATDLALRVDRTGGLLTGSLWQAYPADYRHAGGFARYVLYTDFGAPPPPAVEPYALVALLPTWRAPASLTTLADNLPRQVITRSQTDPLRETTTYLTTAFSLGTQSGLVGASSIPLLATFTQPAQSPTMYLFASPLPCHAQTLQHEGLALMSFNFDGIGVGTRRTAWVRAVLGQADDIDAVYCYGARWNDLPTSLGERETVVISARGCYVGLMLTRVGPAADETGPPAKPASLRWSQPERQGDLMLTINGRHDDYPLSRPLQQVRVGVIINIVPQADYANLEAFVRYFTSARFQQSVKVRQEVVSGPDQARQGPEVIVPQPRSKREYAYRQVVEQSIELKLGEQVLTLVEDLKNKEVISRTVNGQTLPAEALWDAPGFTLGPGKPLAEALTPFQ